MWNAKEKFTYSTESSYDAKRGIVVFSTSHFSTYSIAYEVSSEFTDRRKKIGVTTYRWWKQYN